MDFVNVCMARTKIKQFNAIFMYVYVGFNCLQVSKYWNILALDGSNWQKIDLFDFQRDIEVN